MLKLYELSLDNDLRDLHDHRGHHDHHGHHDRRGHHDRHDLIPYEVYQAQS